MRVSYKLSKRDVLEAKEKHAGLWIRILPIFGIIVLAAGLVSLVHDPKQFPSFVGAIVIGLFLTFFLRLQVWLAFRQDNRLQDEFDASISDSGIDVSSPKGVSKYNWSAFARYVETKNLFLVYQAPHVFNAFPKRAFTPADVNTFRSLLDQKLGAASIASGKRIRPLTWVFLVFVTITAILLAMAVRNIRPQ